MRRAPPSAPAVGPIRPSPARANRYNDRRSVSYAGPHRNAPSRRGQRADRTVHKGSARISPSQGMARRRGLSAADGEQADMPGVRRAGRALLAIVALVVGTSALVACTSDPPQPCPTAARPGLAIAVGGRANAPAPVVPDRVGQLIDKAVSDGTGIDVIRVDGHPSIACALSFTSDAANPVARADDLNRYKQTARGILGATRAKEPEANPLQALVLASQAAGPGGPVALI